MAYTLSIPLSLPATSTGLTDLQAQILDTAGATVGGAISATFVEIGSGLYAWTGTNAIPDNHRGCIYFYSNADPTAILAVASINPEEAETVTTIATDVAGLDGAAMRGTDGAYTGTPPTADAIADAVFDEALADHNVEDSVGNVLNDLTEESGGVYRLTAAALVVAPTGAVSNVTVSQTTLGASPRVNLSAQQYAALGPWSITAASAQTGDSHQLLVYAPNATTPLWALSSTASEISVGGTGNLTLTISDTDAHTSSAGTWEYRLMNVTDDAEVCRGTLTIEPGPNLPTT